MRENLFADVDGIEELLGQMVGAGAMCWENVGAAGVFDSTQTCRFVEDGIRRLSQILGGSVSGDEK